MSEFLATAQVLIAPNIKGFEATLKAELAAIAKRNPLVIPVVAGGAAKTQAAAAATTGLANAQRAAGAATQKATTTATALTRAQTAQTVTARKLTFATGEIANAASAVSASQIRATRTAAAFASAQKAVDLALLAQDPALIKTARDTLALAEAQNLAATSALREARAQSVKTASLAQAQRGLLATTLAQGGVRGATLAASNSFLIGAAAAVTFFKSISAAASVEQELNVFRVTASATGDEMRRVADEARTLGQDITLPGVSAVDAAQAMTGLAKAGLDVEQSLSGAKGVLQLAAAAQIDNAAATELAASALNAFQLSGDKAIHVADLLTNAANAAQGSIADMGLALKQSAAVADLVGVSLDDTVALLTILARAGLQGSDAGTSLRVALLRLINPTQKAAKIFKELGVNLRDASGNIRPEVFAELNAALGELSVKQRQASLAILFGADASRAAALLGRAGIGVLNETRDALDKQGAAADLAAARSQGFSGQMSALSSNLTTLGVDIGTVLLPVLGGFVDGLNKIVIGLDKAVLKTIDFVTWSRKIEISTDDVNDLAGSINDLKFNEGFVEDFKDTFLGTRFRPDASVADIEAMARTLRILAQSPEEIASVFRNSSSDIGKALRDGILDPLEIIELQASETGRAFLAGFAATDPALQKVIRVINLLKGELGRLPTRQEVEIVLKAANFTEGLRLVTAQALKEGTLSGEAFAKAFAQSASRPDFNHIGTALVDGLKSLTPKVSAAGQDVGAAAAQGITVGTDVKLAVAEAQGAPDSEVLGILREREAKQAAFLERMLARPQTKAVQETVKKAAANLEQTRSQIQGILDQQAADAKSNAAAIVTARNEADQDVLDSLGLEERRRRNAVTAALTKEGLQDDIKAAINLRNFYKRSIEEVRKTVKDAKTRAQQIAVFTGELITAEAAVRQAQQAQQDAIRQNRRDARERLNESLDLDIQIAQATGNRSKEIKAHEAKIRQLQREIRQTRKGSVERKRLILELRQEQKELAELKAEKKKTNDATSAMFFEFLQKQQGFAANLLGNLIPGSATGGLVGGTSGAAGFGATGGGLGGGVGGGLGKESQIAAGRDDGFSRGQGQTTNELLRKIYRSLENLNGRAGHPEARYQRVSSGGAMDTM